ncbi:MAG: spermidine/putrescine ABC transporter substrate-binding protein, partial [Phycisphaerae bacterium]
VQYDLYANNEELFAKLKEGTPGYDVIVPTNDFVERMIKAEMLAPLDHGKIPNFRENVAKAFQDANFDPGRKYSMPYMWGTQGIGYRQSRVNGVPDSWKVLLDSDEYSGRIALLSSASAVIGMGLKYLGYSYNSKNPAEIKKVEEMLIRQKPHIKVFAEDNGQDLLASGEVDLTMEWNGDILQVMEEDDDIAYIVPKEGSVVWQDCLAIPVGAPHPDNAHRFINYILDAEAGAKIADFIQYATPNAAARRLLPDEYNNNPAIFPSAETLARSEPEIYTGEASQRLRDEAWTRILAS